MALLHKSVECFTYIIVKCSFEHSVVTTPNVHNVSISLTLFFLSLKLLDKSGHVGLKLHSQKRKLNLEGGKSNMCSLTKA